MLRSLLSSLSLCLMAAALGVACSMAEGADEAGPAAKPPTDRLAPAEVVKPVVPSRSELAESAFKKLDATGKGYVTPEDTSGLEGFDQAFRGADADHTGKLDLEHFKRAWARYSGYKDKN